MCRSISILVLLLAAVGYEQQAPSSVQAQTEAKQQDANAGDKTKPQKYESFTPPETQQEIEKKVLSRLSEGKQSEAEDLLAEHVKTIPEIERFPELISHGKQSDAFQIVKDHADVYRDNQRLIFLHAALMRSRFETAEAFPYFFAAGMAKEKTVTGQCCLYLIGLDGMEQIKRHPEKVFADLERMIDSHPDEIIVRWMLAVQCRSFDRNEQGVTHYKKILEKWNPGPVLVHQTYGNLLDELKRYDEALVERRKAVELEPRGWSYDGLGNTLDFMGRYDEASEAHAKAQEHSPASGHHLGNWALNAQLRKKYDEAIEKCETATLLDPTYVRSWLVWGECLEIKGKKTEAMKKYRRILERYPNNEDAKQHIESLKKALGEEPQDENS